MIDTISSRMTYPVDNREGNHPLNWSPCTGKDPFSSDTLYENNIQYIPPNTIQVQVSYTICLTLVIFVRQQVCKLQTVQLTILEITRGHYTTQFFNRHLN